MTRKHSYIVQFSMFIRQYNREWKSTAIFAEMEYIKNIWSHFG